MISISNPFENPQELCDLIFSKTFSEGGDFPRIIAIAFFFLGGGDCTEIDLYYFYFYVNVTRLKLLIQFLRFHRKIRTSLSHIRSGDILQAYHWDCLITFCFVTFLIISYNEWFISIFRSSSMEDCALGKFITQPIEANKINFTDRVGGVANPMRISFTSWPVRIQHIVKEKVRKLWIRIKNKSDE